MLHYLEVGGPILWILVLCSILTLAISLERIVYFTRFGKGVGNNFKIKINELISENKVEEAIKLCNSKNSCVSSVIRTFLKRTKKGLDVQDYDNILKEIVLENIAPFEKYMKCLSGIISCAPMLGLLGTVTGMIRAFTNISKFGSGDAAVVADGIAEALLTTAAGLIIAIPVIVLYSHLNGKIEKMENEIDKIATNIINIFRRDHE